jgi:ATP-binding cassette subfamily C protein LapB
MIEDRSEFGLPIKLWLTKEDAIVGLLLSSFIINLLGLVFPICVLQFYDRVIPHKSDGTLIAMVLIVLVALLGEMILKILRAYVSSWSSARFTYNMGKKLFHNLLYADLSQFRFNTAGIYLDKFNSAESIKEYYCGQSLTLLIDVPFILIYLFLMFFISPYLAAVPTLVIFVMLGTGILSSKNTQTQLESKNNLSEQKSKFLIELISGIHTIKALGLEEQFLRRYERLHQREITSNYELIQSMSESSRSGAFYSQLGVILTAFVGGILVIYHDVTVGGMAASILLTGRLMLPVTKFITYVEKKKQLTIAQDDLAYIMSFKPEYPDGLQKIESLRGEIQLQDVAFKYPSAEKYVLSGINLHINPNETIVLHGAAFSGKSTLMMLISSLYKPTSGNIKIDGIDLSQIDLDSYRNKIAFMTETGEIFTGTILENLTLFEPDKYAERAKELSRILGFHDFIEATPQSYDTMIGTGTIDIMSKGHKQLILIIRTLIKDPKIVLFDEANLALDVDSDIRLRKFLLSQKGKCTQILSTHRPSLIAMGDRHFKLEDGKLVEFKWQQ